MILEKSSEICDYRKIAISALGGILLVDTGDNGITIGFPALPDGLVNI